MLLTFMRAKIGADETVFFKYFFDHNIDFTNIDDTTYSNFNATSNLLRTIRRLLRPLCEQELCKAARQIIKKTSPKLYFIFNGRGINQKVLAEIPQFAKVIFFNPDFVRHKEHEAIIKRANIIISTKPPKDTTELSAVQFICNDKEFLHINPIMFATKTERLSLLKDRHLPALSTREIKFAFLGNFSKFKRNFLRKLSEVFGEKIIVIGEGWTNDENLQTLGPIYGSALSAIFSNVQLAISIPDAVGDAIDPITVRYFQYPILGAPSIFFANDLNRNLLENVSQFCFANLTEAKLIVERFRKFDEQDYSNELALQTRFVVNNTLSAEELFLKLDRELHYETFS